MKILTGKRHIYLSSGSLAERIQGYSPIHIDVGAGSGKLMLKHSGMNRGGFYIGLDPCADCMYENSVKAAKRTKKTGLDNLLFVIASIEDVPDELEGIADIISVILPWGSLRDGIVKADFGIVSCLRKLGKPGSTLEVIVGYDESRESREMQKRSLPALSRKHFESLHMDYRSAGIKIQNIGVIGNCELKMIESDWAKKLAYGRLRTVYRLDCVYL